MNFEKMIRKITVLAAAILLPAMAASSQPLTLSNENISVSVSRDGNLAGLKNLKTGQDYASGDYLWRLYYDDRSRKEIEITGEGQHPDVSMENGAIVIKYDGLVCGDRSVDMQLCLKIRLEADKVRFESSVTNNEDDTVIRELHYPLVRGVRSPADHALYTAEGGGKLYSDPVGTVMKVGSTALYKTPAQFFRQMDLKYGAAVSLNCFGLFGEKQGLYFGSHDDSFQDTWHGIRVYRDEERKFSILELGLYKYPHCFCGETWECGANVVAPYTGTWHVASGIYRRWADTWWDHRESPQWVKEMKSWQRIIFKHQYGEYLFKYEDLNGRIAAVDKTVGCNAVFMFGWWQEGMDNGNPDYSPDMSQGGDEALKAAISRYRAGGGKLLLYYNGKLIDRESSFWRSGRGDKICRRDNTGSEINEHYRFTGMGTWLGEYDSRTFAVAQMMQPEWNQKLFDLQDRAYALGANSVFFDQLGFIERRGTDWDIKNGYPVPDVYGIRKRGSVLKLLRDRYAEKDPEFCLGTEGLVDYLCQYCDWIHNYPENYTPERFLRFFNYTFPEIIFSDRGMRDDEDVPRRVNWTLLDGQVNDIEIYRCRDLIDDTPVYQAYLAKMNAIRERYGDELMFGRYNDDLGIDVSASGLEVRSFVSEDAMAVVIANQANPKSVTTKISVPGYEYAESSVLGNAQVGKSGKKVKLGQYDLAVLLFRKTETMK